MRLRRLLVLTAAIAPLAVIALIPPQSASASCVGPSLTVGADPADVPAPDAPPLPVSAAGPLEVSGQWFREGCNDTVGMGCDSANPESPLTDVDLVLRQGGTTWPLGTTDAGGRGEQYSVHWRVDLPAAANEGEATLAAGGAELVVTIEPDPVRADPQQP